MSHVLSHQCAFKPPGEITCHQWLGKERALFTGLADGSIAMFRRKLDVPQGHVDAKPQLLTGHQGGLRGNILGRKGQRSGRWCVWVVWEGQRVEWVVGGHVRGHGSSCACTLITK